MVRLLLLACLVLLGACQQSTRPVELDEVAAAARAGEPQAMETLVGLLGEEGVRTNDRVYALMLELGDKMTPVLLPHIHAADRIRREYVIGALGNFKAAAAVDPIAGVLADRQLGRRYIAAWALGEIGGERAVEALVASLDDADDEVRKYATRSLIKQNRLSVAPLIAYLQNDHPAAAKAAAIRALGDISDPAALEILLAQLGGDNRADTVTALGKLKDPRAVDALVGVLGDPAWQVRMNAATALGPIGGEAQAPALEALLEDDVNVVREWAARSLEMMTGRRYTYRNEAGEYVQPYNIYH